MSANILGTQSLRQSQKSFLGCHSLAMASWRQGILSLCPVGIRVRASKQHREPACFCLLLPQLRHRRQCLSHDVLRAQQPLHPHFWREWSWEDGGLQEDPPVLCGDLSDDGVAPNSPRQAAALHSSPGGEWPPGSPPRKSSLLPK